MPKVSTKALTDTRIQRAKVEKDKDGNPRTSYLWDSTIRGFGLRVTAQGAKTFCMKFVDPSGKQAWLALGPYTGEKSLESAKEQAGEFRTMLSKHLDPRVESKRHLDVPTVEKFTESHLEAQKAKLRPASYKATKYYLDSILVPEFAGQRMDQIQRNQVEALIDKVATGWRPGMKAGERPSKATPTAANRFHAALSKFFTEAERKGHRPQGSNPCKLIEKRSEAKNKERFLSAVELKALGDAMRAAENANAALEHPDRTVPYAMAAIRLLMFTGARLNEILQLKWDQVDKARGVIRIDRHKTSGKKGAKELPLNAAMLAILEGLEKLPTRKLGGGWVIQGHKYGAHLVNLQKPWNRIRTEAKCPDVRIHDLRHTFASVGVGLGLSLHQVGNLLGHSQPAVTNRYAHLDSDPRLQASEKISSQIAAAIG